jgi:hypothetical protein
MSEPFSLSTQLQDTAEYRIEYQSGEIERIENYESRLLATAQQKVDEDHRVDSVTGHSPIISVFGLSN